MKSKMKSSKMFNKAKALKGFMNSMSKPKMKKGGSFPDLNKDGQITKAGILMGRGVINKPKAQKGMNVMKEAKKNATPSIPNSYYAMGGMKEVNPLASMMPKKPMKSAKAKISTKPKMQMGALRTPKVRFDAYSRYNADEYKRMSNTMPNKKSLTDSAAYNKNLNMLKDLYSSDSSNMGKKETIKKGKMKPKMQMGGPFFSMKPNTPMIATEGKYFENKESFKKGGMIKKKKK